MSKFLFAPALLVLAGPGGVHAGEKVLVPGDLPLTQSMVDEYCRYVAWCCPQAFAQAGGSQRLGQLVVNDWKNGDRARQRAVLAGLKWWREEFPKLGPPERERRSATPLRLPPGEDAELGARDQEAIHLGVLQQHHNARQQHIRALSNLQAEHHETMMLIIANMRPSGRYVYNPATGRYDRYVP